MTRVKLIQIAKIALGNHSGETSDQQAVAVADAIELFLRMEAEDGGVIDRRPDPAFDPTVGKFADAGREYVNIPASPAVRPAPPSAPAESSRLVIMPDSQEAREALARGLRPDPSRAVDPIAISRVGEPPSQRAELSVGPPKEGSGPPGEKVYWRVQDISNVLHEKTPEKIRITIEHPDKGPIPITLERNVQIGAGFDVVKLIYKAPWAPDGFEVSETFSCSQAELPIGAALDRIEKNALTVYSPRERVLTSRTPVKKGELSFDYDTQTKKSKIAAAGDET